MDTPPFGATRRLLAAGDALAAWCEALDAMAEKAEVVAGTFVKGIRVTMAPGVRNELHATLDSFRALLERAGFVLVEHGRTADAVAAELAARGLGIATRVTRAAAMVSGAAVSAVRGGRQWLEALEPRLLLFAGKGGVGRTTCAAGAALALSRTRAVRLLEIDPAGDAALILGPAHRAVEMYRLDPSAALRMARERYDEHVARFFQTIGLEDRAPLDRRVLDALWRLAPPGADEAVALAELLEAMKDSDTIVVDAAATGHFARLIAMPEFALRWARDLLALLRRLGAAGLGDVVDAIGAFAAEVRALRARLMDARATAAIVVTLTEPVVRAETERLLARLASARLPVAALLVNRVQPGAALPDAHGMTRIVAREQSPPPAGDELIDFVNGWEVLPWAA